LHFISTTQLSEPETGKLAGLCSRVFQNPNIGLDFGMWQLAILAVDLSAWDELVLVNSSVHGPVHPLQRIFEDMAEESCDFWGLTDSYEIDYHLQSYFLVFRKPALESHAFKRFWASVLPYHNKWQIIRSYEIGLTQFLREQGLSCSVRFPYAWLRRDFCRQVRWNRQRPLDPTNPAIAYAEPLLTGGMPFFKVALLRDNPLRQDLSGVRSLLEQLGYPMDWVQVAGGPAWGLRSEPRPTCCLCGASGRTLYTSRLDSRERSGTGWHIAKCVNDACGLLWLDPAPVPEAPRLRPSGLEPADPVEGNLGRGSMVRGYNRLQRYLLGLYNRTASWSGLDSRRHASGRAHPAALHDRKCIEIHGGDKERLGHLRTKASRGAWLRHGRRAVRKPAPTVACEANELPGLHLQAAAYDHVILGHGLEHAEDPVALLQECRRLLTPGGRLYLETPNAGGLTHWLFRMQWGGLDVPRHRQVFNLRNLKALLEKAGFGNALVRTSPIDAEGYALQSLDLRRQRCSRPDSIGYRLGEELTALAVQLIALAVHRIFPRSGDTCIVEATIPHAGPPGGS
jgi:SAM-dependent methyltransferase